MATTISQESICRLVKDSNLELQTDATIKPIYNGIAVIEDKVLVIDYMSRNLQLYSRCDGKLLSTSHRLESIPNGVCPISMSEVAVCLWNGTIVILSFTSIGEVKRVKILDVRKIFHRCHSVAKLNADKLVVSGRKFDDWMICWGVVSISDGRLDSAHNICLGYGENCTHLAIKDSTVYISCPTFNSSTNGVYAYEISNPDKPKFLYQHQELKTPWSIMADRNSVYVSDEKPNRIHQLTDIGQLVTIHTVLSRPNGLFYDDQQGVVYTTSDNCNVITVYKQEYLPQPVIPAEVLKMDTKSLQMYKEALNEGNEKVYNIRVMMVGQYGVGKTTLTQLLLGNNVNISERHSTEGIDVHVECSKVSLPDGEWTTQEKGSAENDGIIQMSLGKDVLTAGGCNQHTCGLIK